MADSATTCRYCQFYRADRRWAGECQLLQVSVGSDWPACRSSSQLFSEPTAAVPALSAAPVLSMTEAEWSAEAQGAYLKAGVA
ncbi:hypothetical protein VZH09_13095 [Synechococcus elongatus IITB7]|uniref:hypothetical protein n=1 Tax=Synechococcus elongatus TaxID=32046 RepID=UPI0030D424CA